jgi:hypothetical protein
MKTIQHLPNQQTFVKKLFAVIKINMKNVNKDKYDMKRCKCGRVPYTLLSINEQV